MKPQLAKDAPLNPDGTLKVNYPLAVQVKLDGIRCCVVDGKALTRSLKEIPNREIFEALSKPEFEGLDGEIILGDPAEEGCFGRTTSYVMTPHKKTGGDWTFHVFDLWNHEGTFEERYQALQNEMYYRLNPSHFRIVPTTVVSDESHLMELEAALVAEGHEGVIIRNPSSLYKFGRSGTKSGEALKIKRFKDGEARILDAYERLHNANEATTNALGRTERSSHKANKIGRGDLGGFTVQDILTGQRFNIGTGFNDAQRKELWELWHKPGGTLEEPVPVKGRWLRGRIVKYKHFEVGSKDLPRFPVFLGFRDERDMS